MVTKRGKEVKKTFLNGRLFMIDSNMEDNDK